MQRRCREGAEKVQRAEVEMCRGAGAEEQVQRSRCRRCRGGSGEEVQVQVQMCRCADVLRCKMSTCRGAEKVKGAEMQQRRSREGQEKVQRLRCEMCRGAGAEEQVQEVQEAQEVQEVQEVQRRRGAEVVRRGAQRCAEVCRGEQVQR